MANRLIDLACVASSYMHEKYTAVFGLKVLLAVQKNENRFRKGCSGKQRGPGEDQWKAKRSWKRHKTHPSFGKDLGMGGGKGGARHEVKPWVDVGLLYTCLEKHQKLVADLGAYEHVSSQAAPNAKALLELTDLWTGLLELSPVGSIHSQPLRQALVSLLASIPESNSGKHSGAVWGSLERPKGNWKSTTVKFPLTPRACLQCSAALLEKRQA